MIAIQAQSGQDGHENGDKGPTESTTRTPDRVDHTDAQSRRKRARELRELGTRAVQKSHAAGARQNDKPRQKESSRRTPVAGLGIGAVGRQIENRPENKHRKSLCARELQGAHSKGRGQNLQEYENTAKKSTVQA